MTEYRTCSLLGCDTKVQSGGAPLTRAVLRDTDGTGKCAMHLARFRIHGSYDIPEKVNICKGGCGTELRRDPAARTGIVPVWCKTCQRANFNATRAAARVAAKAVILATPLTCSRCSQTFFLDPAGRVPPIMPKCCGPCKKARDYETVRKWIKANPEAYGEMARRHARQRRVRLRQVEYEDFSDLEVFERDGWICQLCMQPVDKTLVWPDRMMATLDHKVPVSCEGPDIALNARLAHYSCNSSRGHRVSPEELELLWAELDAARAEAQLLEELRETE